MDAQKIKTVFTITERAGKSYWTRVGVGHVNNDGSIGLKLDAIPINGTLQVRDYEPPGEARHGERNRRAASAHDAPAFGDAR